MKRILSKKSIVYFMVFILSVLLISCNNQGSSTAVSEGKLAITDLSFAGGDQANMIKKNNFKAGETIWILFNVKNYEKRPRTGSSIEIWVREQIRITDPAGQVILLKYNFFDFHKVYRKPINAPLPIQNQLQLPEGVTKGNYTVKIQVLDYVGLNAAQATGVFAVQ